MHLIMRGEELAKFVGDLRMIRQELVSVRLLSSLHRLQVVRDDLAELIVWTLIIGCHALLPAFWLCTPTAKTRGLYPFGERSLFHASSNNNQAAPRLRLEKRFPIGRRGSIMATEVFAGDYRLACTEATRRPPGADSVRRVVRIQHQPVEPRRLTAAWRTEASSRRSTPGSSRL